MLPLAPPPRKEDGRFDDWMFRLWKRIASTGGLAWSLIDKTGSNLTEIETRNHADLQNINTATYTHLSATNHTDLTDGGLTTLHLHDTDHVTYPASLEINNPTHVTTLQTILDHSWSSGVVDGCDITDNGNGTIGLAVGNVMLRPLDDPHTALYSIETNAQTPISLTDGVVNYVYYQWNATPPNVPTVNVTSSQTTLTGTNNTLAYSVHRDGNILHILDARGINVDNARKVAHKDLDATKFVHATDGTVLGGSGLAITVTAGAFYFMLHDITHVAFDTTIAGTNNANNFEYWRHVAGVYTSVYSKVIDSTLYDDGTGTTTLTNNKYGVTWFYIVNDSPSELHAIMGQEQFNQLADAIIASPPAIVPTLIGGMGVLIGYVIYQKSAVVFADVRSAFTQRFTASTATTHNGLSGLQGGTVDEYYHLTAAQATDLTDAGDSTLHYHTADRSASTTITAIVTTSPHNETAIAGSKVLLVNTTAGSITVNLPTAVSNVAQITIKKIASANSVTIDGLAAETIDGGLTAVLNVLNESITLISDGTNWGII